MAATRKSLPFAWSVEQRRLPMLHADLDYPVRQVVIDGGLWMIFVPGRQAHSGRCPVLRFKGKDLEHLQRLPDGTADLHGASGHLGCGMWWDAGTRTLCFFAECPVPYQFAFIKTGLGPKRPHTINIAVRGDKNPGANGTVIRHFGFECAAGAKNPD